MPAEKIPGWIERLLLPKLSSIEGELKAINSRIDSVDERMISIRNEIKTDIESLRNETKTDIVSLRNETKTSIESLRNETESNRKEILSRFEGLDYRFETINIKLDSLEKRIPVIEEITALKIRMADLEKRLAVA
jgi:predicted  nucleic acid-binding Zn-ribbon protein